MDLVLRDLMTKIRLRIEIRAGKERAVVSISQEMRILVLRILVQAMLLAESLAA
jgi:hypothetical protein